MSGWSQYSQAAASREPKPSMIPNAASKGLFYHLSQLCREPHKGGTAFASVPQRLLHCMCCVSQRPHSGVCHECGVCELRLLLAIDMTCTFTSDSTCRFSITSVDSRRPSLFAFSRKRTAGNLSSPHSRSHLWHHACSPHLPLYSACWFRREEGCQQALGPHSKPHPLAPSTFHSICQCPHPAGVGGKRAASKPLDPTASLTLGTICISAFGMKRACLSADSVIKCASIHSLLSSVARGLPLLEGAEKVLE